MSALQLLLRLIYINYQKKKLYYYKCNINRIYKTEYERSIRRRKL